MIINDDILNWCKEYKGEKFHSLICDPPYELNFMNKGWDNTGIAFRKETWEALKEHLYPGAFCFAFASTRGLHRMMVAIEDAGFIIHPTIFLFAFGSGFPKATRIDTQLQSKEEQEVVGKKENERYKYDFKDNSQTFCDTRSYSNEIRRNDISILREPTDPIAKRWTSHRYGLQSLKPAVEPIICFQKRYKGKPVNCIVETGAGALNIDGGRIKIDNKDKNRRPNGSILQETAKGGNSCFGASGRNPELNGDSLNIQKGRWPSNLIIDKECAERFPMTESGTNNIRNNKNSLHTGVGNGSSCYGTYKDCVTTEYSDSGSAARYFKNVEMKIDAADPVFYTSKVSKEERNRGCEKFEEKDCYNKEYDGLSDLRMLTKQKREKVRNAHPTLKPIDLTTYLATLLLPPIEYAPRRILVPFAGAGSEMIGCLKAGWEDIVGIELTAEYIPIIEARFEYYKKQIELEKSMQLFEPEIMESMKQEKLFE